MIAISQEGPISPGRKRSLIPALRAFARWSLVPSASAPVGRLCNNSSAAMGVEERRRNGAPCSTASAHPLGGGRCCQFANLPICSSAKSPMCPRHNNVPAVELKGKCAGTRSAPGASIHGRRESRIQDKAVAACGRAKVVFYNGVRCFAFANVTFELK